MSYSWYYPEDEQPPNPLNVEPAIGENTDFRAWLQGPSTKRDVSGIFGTGAIMEPLRTGSTMEMGHRVLFPYTPTIQISGNADYEDYSFTHTNYKYNAYSSSSISEIVITGDFTAQTDRESRYMLAVLHFLRTNTKGETGTKAATAGKAGTPPPVLKFNYLGEFQFKNVPVIIKNFTYTLQPDVDYVSVEVDGLTTSVPTYMSLTVTLDTYYNPKKLRDEFSLDDFKNGKLLNQGYL